MTTVDLSDEVTEAIAQTLRDGRRSPKWLAEVGRRFHATRQFVESICEALDRQQLIFESAPAGSHTRGGPMARSLNDQQITEVLRILKVNGTGAPVVTKVASQYGVTESVIEAVGRVITEGAAKILAEDDSSAATANAARDAFDQKWRQLTDEANAIAVKGLDKASIADLQTFGAVAFRGGAMESAPAPAITEADEFTHRRAEAVAEAANRAQSRPLSEASSQELVALASMLA